MRQLLVSALALLVIIGLSDGGTLVRNPPTSSRALPFVTEEEKRCLVQGKVLYSDGKCYSLLAKGPCASAEQWLVLSREAPPRATGSRYECADRPCENIRQFYWPEDELCHSASNVSVLCPYEGTRLGNDAYGEGECACKPAYAQFKPDVLRANQSEEWDGQGVCYPLFRREPCPEGKVLHPEVLAGFGIVARCSPDYCASLNKANPSAGYVMHVKDHQCYQLGSRIAVCNNNTFKVDDDTNLPGCVEPHTTDKLSAWSNIGERCGGENNIDPETKKCREELVINTQYSTYAYRATGQGKSKRRTRRRDVAHSPTTSSSYVR